MYYNTDKKVKFFLLNIALFRTKNYRLYTFYITYQKITHQEHRKISVRFAILFTEIYYYTGKNKKLYD